MSFTTTRASLALPPLMTMTEPAPRRITRVPSMEGPYRGIDRHSSSESLDDMIKEEAAVPDSCPCMPSRVDSRCFKDEELAFLEAPGVASPLSRSEHGRRSSERSFADFRSMHSPRTPRRVEDAPRRRGVARVDTSDDFTMRGHALRGTEPAIPYGPKTMRGGRRNTDDDEEEEESALSDQASFFSSEDDEESETEFLHDDDSDFSETSFAVDSDEEGDDDGPMAEEAQKKAQSPAPAPAPAPRRRGVERKDTSDEYTMRGQSLRDQIQSPEPARTQKSKRGGTRPKSSATNEAANEGDQGGGPQRGVQRRDTSDDFTLRGHSLREQASTEALVPQSNTKKSRRGGKRPKPKDVPPLGNEPLYKVTEGNEDQVLSSDDGEVLSPHRRGVQRHDTSDGYTMRGHFLREQAGQDAPHTPSHGHKSKRGGKKPSTAVPFDDDHEDMDEEDAEGNLHAGPPSRRGVERQDTSDDFTLRGHSLRQATAEPPASPSRTQKSRRGGRRPNKSIGSAEENDSRANEQEEESAEPSHAQNASGPPPRRGVQRNDTSDDFTLRGHSLREEAGTDAPHTPSHDHKSTRGGRRPRGQNDDGKKEAADEQCEDTQEEHKAMSKPRCVLRNDTSDEYTLRGHSLRQEASPPATTTEKSRRGGKRLNKSSAAEDGDEANDGSESRVEEQAGEIGSEHQTPLIHHVRYHPPRHGAGEAPASPSRTQKSRRGGKRPVSAVKEDASDNVDESESAHVEADGKREGSSRCRGVARVDTSDEYTMRGYSLRQNDNEAPVPPSSLQQQYGMNDSSSTACMTDSMSSDDDERRPTRRGVPRNDTSDGFTMRGHSLRQATPSSLPSPASPSRTQKSRRGGRRPETDATDEDEEDGGPSATGGEALSLDGALSATLKQHDITV